MLLLWCGFRQLIQALPTPLQLLDIVGRPEDLVVTHITVPPVAIRPSVEMDGASNEDDITMKLMVRRWWGSAGSVVNERMG
jgi:DNA-directed RNA polymerase beta' subunit